MKEIAEVWTLIQELLASQRLAVLSTQGQRQPYSNLVAFAFTADLKYLIFATTRATRKYDNLLKNPEISILIDNRTNETADFAEAMAVTVLGQASEVQGDERSELLKTYVNRQPARLKTRGCRPPGTPFSGNLETWPVAPPPVPWSLRR